MRNRLIFVNHWGQSVSFDGSEEGGGCCRDQIVPYGNPGTGKFNPSSITVYSLDAVGNVAPLRVIKGDRTQLNWPANMAVDQQTGDLYVANDVGHSVLVFSGMNYVRGNVPPTRMIKGDRTNLLYPTGVFVDRQNQELWVSNLGNGSANVYRLNANGNVEPLRTIRAAPRNHISMTFGRPASIAYDTNREEILVPN
jgi:DNA-binding beta-propeller fold protein YncE